MNALHIAAQGDRPASIVFFVQAGLRIDSCDAKGRTPLHWAVHYSSNYVLEYILAVKQNLEIRDDFGYTALHKAIPQVSYLDSDIVVKTLVMRGANK